LSAASPVIFPIANSKFHCRIEPICAFVRPYRLTRPVERMTICRDASFFGAEAEKLDGWADDFKVVLEREIKERDRQIKEVRRAATAALTLEEKLAGEKQVKALEPRNAKRRALFHAQDDIDRRKAQLIAEIEGKLQQRASQTPLFSIHWSLA
jgi:hypothetical protein